MTVGATPPKTGAPTTPSSVAPTTPATPTTAPAAPVAATTPVTSTGQPLAWRSTAGRQTSIGSLSASVTARNSPTLPSMTLGESASAKSLSNITQDYPALASVLSSQGRLTNQDLVNVFSANNVSAPTSRANAAAYGLSFASLQSDPAVEVDLTAPTPTSSLARNALLDEAMAKLLKGAKNTLVRSLQEDLLSLPGFEFIGEADGDYGNNTAKAVKQFAASVGIQTEGLSVSAEVLHELMKAKEVLAQDFAAIAQDSDDLTRELSAKNRPLLNQLRDKFEDLDKLTNDDQKADAETALVQWLSGAMNESIRAGRHSPAVATQWKSLEGVFSRATERGSLSSEVTKFRGEVQAQLMADFTGNSTRLTQGIAATDPVGAQKLLEAQNTLNEAKPSEAMAAFKAFYETLEGYMRENQSALSPEATRQWRHIQIEYARAERGGGDGAVLALSRRQRKAVLQTAIDLIARDAKAANPNADTLELSEGLAKQLRLLESNAANAGAFTPEMLRRIVPTMTEARAEKLIPEMNKAMNEAGIVSPRARAAFVAQLAHETAGFVFFSERGGESYFKKMYEPNFRLPDDAGDDFARRQRRATNLGNTQPGDGPRFRGRGAIQLTGRANYTEASKALFPNETTHLLTKPESAEQLDLAFRTSSWFWNRAKLTPLADAGDFEMVTKRINGGYNGLDDRMKYYARALDVLGAGAPV